MTIRKLPRAQNLQRPKGLDWDPPSDALASWAEMPRAAESEDGATIAILEQIGEDWWTGEGVSAKAVAARLAEIGPQPVRVEINSPGGDFFEGLAIYNQLLDHPAEVTVKVLGMAASAASVIAMAGDRVVMGRGSFLFVHDTWAVAVGNRHDMRAAADVLEPFDSAIAGIYQARSGQDRAAIEAMMDKETWITAEDAVDQGFADEIAAGAAPPADGPAALAALPAKKQIDIVLAKGGMPRAERRRLLRKLGGTPGAAPDTATLRAGETAAIGKLLANLNRP